MEKITRGHLLELEAIVVNTQNAIEHYFDLGSWSLQDIETLKSLRSLRKEITRSYFPKDINYKYWCIYKHILCACGQFRELIQFQMEYQSDSELSSMFETYKELESILQMVRLAFFNIDPSSLEDPKCIRCLEDFFISKMNKNKARC